MYNIEAYDKCTALFSQLKGILLFRLLSWEELAEDQAAVSAAVLAAVSAAVMAIV